ncbi:MAG: hypothetical protein C7B44_06590 [Sulfobacillus thermosulfidooxidans]|uniref:dTMP kinase n=1 Tax=Sulfobacillus TaxID=28033 RepID=UPI000CD14467|nr:hypothetical protein [Sulfobacillus sp. hq2]MCY0907903.1 hypothetical protein [Sulfobacillus thermotolerans]POB10789.1 hypothetical protein CO251_08230 [Sulfobacillus sp. hq2]PSR36890.1 MAG: hypothetical protein C7B44_06590 [Sulfobacillus thermosulfidooxidans]
MGRPVRTVAPQWPYVDTYYPGLYVGVDGLDGSGRTTLANELHRQLQSHGYPSVVTGPFPSKKSQTQNTLNKHDRRVGDTSRHLLYASFLAIVMHEVILPHLRAGYIVISDRSWISLYARATAQGLDKNWVTTSLGFALQPDLVIEPAATPLTAARRKLAGAEALDPLESVGGRSQLSGFIAFQEQIQTLLAPLRQQLPWHVVEDIKNLDQMARIIHRIEAESEGLPS